ncbi:hypothetical protein MKW92_019784 [Papaver armeniacum]|nr:hypothetical protein MKW92_019784 [Papaver armeniacum]
MYATKPLSLYRKNPSILSTATRGSSISGYIVITDEETEAEDTCCWGICKDPKVGEFPFPQNKIVNVVYTSGSGKNRTTDTDKVWFIPVIDLPLSSNRYYVITTSGKYKGSKLMVEFELDFTRQTCTCSREEDMTVCCFCNVVKDVKPRVFDHRDIYQSTRWTVYTSSSYDCQLDEALGLNVSLRTRLPPEPIHQMSSKDSTPVVVGGWYCPFVFIREGIPKEQMKNSLFYKMTLEQSWEEIYSCENFNSAGNFVSVNVTLQKETIRLFGNEAKKNSAQGGDGFIWYGHVNSNTEGSELVLSAAIVEKMKWVQQQGGYEIEGENKDVTVERVENFGEGNEWRRFRFFVLVERFALRRMDGTLVLTCDYKHTHQTRSKWD